MNVVLASDYHKDLFRECHRQGARSTCSPRPRLRDADVDCSYAQAQGYEG